ncbi:hypothetical protein [Sphaerospermopsis aphanizomenoides]|uniref:hypothetical protein n=1 Tax=Sphaerospermopsis aphanizomenoides TaxID=459663 RepID=UPI001908FA0E|nr:hypothetical protein [Sphaerospermopsis aphanizomenoides]
MLLITQHFVLQHEVRLVGSIPSLQQLPDQLVTESSFKARQQASFTPDSCCNSCAYHGDYLF